MSKTPAITYAGELEALTDALAAAFPHGKSEP